MTVAPMNGFVMDGLMRNATAGKSVMKCFNAKTVPVISTLAQEFMVFDRCVGGRSIGSIIK